MPAGHAKVCERQTFTLHEVILKKSGYFKVYRKHSLIVSINHRRFLFSQMGATNDVYLEKHKGPHGFSENPGYGRACES